MNFDPGTYYKITAKSSGKCLDVTGGSNAVADNGARLQQWDYIGGDNQKWRFADVGGGYEIIPKHSIKCLDVIGGPAATSNGIGIQIWDYLGGSNQKWRIQDADGAADYRREQRKVLGRARRHLGNHERDSDTTMGLPQYR